MPNTPLAELDTAAIDNVYVFLADAVRYDEVPTGVTDLGVSFKTVAHALTTPQCLPTIFSGRLPQKHGVTWFNHTVPPDLHTVFDLEGVDTGYSELLWLGSALQDVLGNPGEADVETATEPFVVVEHDNGGHAPYPETDAGSPAEMTAGLDAQADLVSMYRETVAGSAERFRQRLSALDERGSLENTLVVYLADHGELLGEHGGFFGHQLPMTPELVYVPTVFVHPSLPSGTEGDHLLQQVDLYPTITDVLGEERASDGRNLTTPVEEDTPAYSRTVVHPPGRYHDSVFDPAYEADGVWTDAGGHVFVENSRPVRVLTSLYEGLLSGHTAAYNSNRNRLVTVSRVLGHYLRNEFTYGHPPVTPDEARDLIAELDSADVESVRRELTEETKSHLADLGYR